LEKTHTLAVVIASLLLLGFAYLPTLQFDYAVRDQWRAFRLPESLTRLNELDMCASEALPFYVRSGRPLVWVGECIERALVSNIRDFWYLRLISFGILLATLLYLAAFLSESMGIETALFAATAFVMLPGFIFMAELGLNGAPVVLAVTTAVASFSQLRRSAFATGRNVLCTRSARASVLFVIACFLYPAWAFSIVPLALIRCGLTETDSIAAKVRSCGRLLLFYAFASVIYFCLAKLMVWADLFGSANINMGDGRYEMSPHLAPAVLASRIGRAMWFVFDGYLWDLPIKRGLMSIGVIAFAALTCYRTSRERLGVPAQLLTVVVAGLTGFAGIGLSMAPWLLSGMQEVHDRFFVAAYLLPIVSIFAAVPATLGKLRANARLCTIVGLCISLLAAFAVNKVTYLDVTASLIRTDFVRQEVNSWLDKRGYETVPLLLLVPPYGNNSGPRPAFIRRLLRDPDGSDTGKWSGDLNHYYEVVSAILRERQDHPVGRSVGLINCGFDKACRDKNLEQGEPVFAWLSESEAAQGHAVVPAAYALINVSELTAQPIRPTFDIVRRSESKARQ
jgi:hypothetical protein